MPTINQTIQKIRKFANLPSGWHYGSGTAIDSNELNRVEEFLLEADRLELFEANAFPQESGEIEVTIYQGDKTFAFLFDEDVVTITEECGSEILSDEYGKSFVDAEQKLWEISQKNQTVEVSLAPQTISALSTSVSGMFETKNLETQLLAALRKTTTRNRASQLSRQDVFWSPPEQSANTVGISIVPLLATP